MWNEYALGVVSPSFSILAKGKESGDYLAFQMIFFFSLVMLHFFGD